MGLTLKNVKPSYELCKYGNVKHPYSDDFDVISYIKESFVEPVKQPIDPTLPIVIQENNVDIKTEAIANAMAFALYQNDATAIVDVTDFYKQIVYEMSQTNPLHPNKWLVDWARERVNRKTPYPRPNNMVFYTVDSDVIPECKDFLVIGDNQDKVVSAFSYTFNPNSLGVAFRMESDFNDFKEKFAELVNKEASNLSTETSNQCQEFLKTKLSKLTLDIALRNKKFEDNNEPYSFAQLLRYSLDNYIATNNDKSFYIPFQTSEFFLPSVINFINIEKHSHSNKNDILTHWNKIIKLLNSNVKLWNKKSIKSLQKIISMSNQSTSMLKSLHEQKKEDLQRANVPIALSAPSTKILEKRILKIIKKTTDVNKSMNVYKTLKRSFAKPNRRNPDDYDKIIVGYWVDKGDADEKMKAFMSKIRNKSVSAFGTLGAKSDSEHAKKCMTAVREFLESNGNKVEREFICQGAVSPQLIEKFRKMTKEGILTGHHAATPETEKRWAEAAKHPDETDIENAKKIFAGL